MSENLKSESEQQDNNSVEEAEVKVESFQSFVFEMVKVLFISLLIIVPIRAYVVQPFYVDGASMEPNFYDGEYLIVDEISYRFQNPQRGDIVVFHPPSNPKVYYIKRIIGLPGEVVDIQNGQIKVYEKDSIEPLFMDESEYLTAEYALRASEKYHVSLEYDEYYLLGDNRPNSLDSRRFGPIPRDHIKGKVVLRAFPFDRFGGMTRPDYSNENNFSNN
ncbi:MAG: signal peptidase I [Candidatus Komeilibacteria bacterium]